MGLEEAAHEEEITLSILNVVGARSNLMKIALLLAEIARHAEIEQRLLEAWSSTK